MKNCIVNFKGHFVNIFDKLMFSPNVNWEREDNSRFYSILLIGYSKAPKFLGTPGKAMALLQEVFLSNHCI